MPTTKTPRRRRKAIIQPIERFPTKPRADGRFQKRIRGVLHYFGSNGDRAAAHQEYDRVKHDLYAGRVPRPDPADIAGQTVRAVGIRFLADKRGDAEDGKLTWGHYQDCYTAAERFVRHVGKDRLVTDLCPDDFTTYGRALRHKFASGYTVNREVAIVKAMFRHALESDWILQPIRFGKNFRKTPMRELRCDRIDMLVPPQVYRAAVRGAGVQLKAMILLSGLGGYSATDCAELEWRFVDLDAAVIRFARRKTKIERVTPLPPETVAALRAVRRERPDDTLVFRTVKGNPWVRQLAKSNIDAVGHAWAKLLDDLGMSGKWTFSDVRRTFTTHASALGDRDAYRRVVGRSLTSLDGLGDHYILTVELPRLQRVVEHVRTRLLGEVLES